MHFLKLDIFNDDIKFNIIGIFLTHFIDVILYSSMGKVGNNILKSIFGMGIVIDSIFLLIFILLNCKMKLNT